MKFCYENEQSSYQILSGQDLERIHSATLALLKNYGVRVYGEEAKEIYRNAGCNIDEDSGLIRFPEELVNDAISKTPEQYTMCGRNPKDDFVLGDDKVHYTCFGTGIEIVDPETGVRKASDSTDLGNLARFVDAIPEINAFTTAVASQEAPAHVKDLYEARAVFCNTTKHTILDAENGKNANLVIDIAATIAGSREKLRERPFLTLCICPNSPLEIHEGAAEVVIETAKAGLPISILSMGLVGGTTPATLAGTLVVTNAEILAGVVLTQLVNPGNPVMYGSSTTIMDMQYASSPVGAPEHGMFGVAVVEITESIFEDNYDDINNIIQKLRDAGIHIAIDDFGTGYSSLAREKELKVDCLKIDKYFIDKLLYADLNKAITSDIISMAHKLGHCAIAEGVEHESQLQYLKEHDCDRIQGYLISKPLDEKDALAFLKNQE